MTKWTKLRSTARLARAVDIEGYKAIFPGKPMHTILFLRDEGRFHGDIVRWLEESFGRACSVNDVQTGDEYDTRRHIRAHVLPLLRRDNVH